jgi:histidine triad (HIT) family protein
MNCIFCDIIAGKAPASIVYENDFVLGIMSLDQPNPYKAMILPKDHVENIYDLSAEQASHIFQAAVVVANGIKLASKCPGLNLIQSNGVIGQQDVFHFHLHLLPRIENDSVTLNWPNAIAERHDLDQMASEIRSHIADN